jgi:hypothetical protein
MTLLASLIVVVMVISFGSMRPPAQAQSRALTPLSAAVQVDVICGASACTGSSLADSNRTHKLVVSPTGVVSALFWNASGIWVASSTNRGASFSAARRVTTTAVQGETGIGADGTLYVNWNDAGNLNLAKSSNGGATWSAPIRIATGIANNFFGLVQSVHMAIDGEYIYALPQLGNKIYVSSNSGSTWTEKAVSATNRVFSDVHVDPLTHVIYAFLDDPSVYWHSSSDRGLTWSTVKTTGKWVSYSVGALSSNATNKYFYMAGSENKLERLSLTSTAVDTKTIAASDSNTRSLAADGCGNVVTGNKTGPDLYLQYSTDAGNTFSTAERVVSTAVRANASINLTNGDVMYLYEKSGHIYLTTYAGLLGGTGGCYDLTLTRTAVELGFAGDSQIITLTNTSASPMTVTSIGMSGSAFTQTTTCASTIAAGASCTVTISGSTAASEVLTIVLDTVTKVIPVSLGDLASVRPTATPTRVAKVTRTPTATKVVTKKQTITFPAITSKKVTAKSFTLNATASSKLAVKYTSKTTKICTVTGKIVKLLKVGTCTITASQAGGTISGSKYFAAMPVTKSFSITK